eukprot:1967512-Pleurochrysis_carterae.AAC.2
MCVSVGEIAVSAVEIVVSREEATISERIDVGSVSAGNVTSKPAVSVPALVSYAVFMASVEASSTWASP